MPTTVTIPLLNPNEPEARINSLYVSEGQRVTSGQILCTLETTKSSVDLEAEVDGFIVGLKFQQGESVQAGETLCYLSEDPTWIPPQVEVDARGEKLPVEIVKSGAPGGHEFPEGLRITQPALALVQELGFELAELSTDRLITASLVRNLYENKLAAPKEPIAAGKNKLSETSFANLLTRTSDDTRTPIIVYGAGGHGKTLIDLLRILGNYFIAGLVDDGVEQGEEIMGLKVLGGNEILPQLRAQGINLAVNAIGGIGNLGIRIRVFQNLADAGFSCPAIIHPSAIVEDTAFMADGVQVFAHAYIGSQTQIGFGCIVNTGAIVSHDCLLGDYANISPGAMLAGEVQVGEGVLIGMGATINLQVKIGQGAKIGNGATIKENVPEKVIVHAGTIWPIAPRDIDKPKRRIV